MIARPSTELAGLRERFGPFSFFDHSLGCVKLLCCGEDSRSNASDFIEHLEGSESRVQRRLFQIRLVLFTEQCLANATRSGRSRSDKLAADYSTARETVRPQPT
jgi:hypothetical protein